MSGILTILNTDGAPVDPELVGRLTDCMAERGPDGQATHVDGPLGMGHTAFHTTVEAANERQPLSFEGDVWLNADARIDGRAELRRELAAAGREVAPAATDADFILHAYHAWGTECVQHLIGDFAFTIWDGPRQRLFCARDHFGVRPLFYVAMADTLIVGNTLSCLRRHPAVSQELDDLALIDFLLFGRYQEAGLTAYAAIRRLPPAHFLLWEGARLHVESYWELPMEDPLLYQNGQEYVEQFGELFTTAVIDRLRAAPIAVSISGGLDSTAVAAVAVEQLNSQGEKDALWAFTNGYRRLIPDEESRYAQIAADYLGIPLQVRELDDYQWFQDWDKLDLRSSEPVDQALIAWNYDQDRDVAARSRVVLTGFGGDPLLYPEPGYFYALLGRGQIRRLLSSVQQCRQNRKFPPLYLRTWLRGRFGGSGSDRALAPLPAWFNPELAQRYDLEERRQEFHRDPVSDHPLRPTAAALLDSLFWSSVFEGFDADHRFFPLETRHPFFDIRLVNFALRVPPAPWYVDKFLLRSFLDGRLPPQIVSRPKTPLAGHPFHRLDPDGFQKTIARLLAQTTAAQRYGDLQVVIAELQDPSLRKVEPFESNMRFVVLANWQYNNGK
jgi:asparagine synthase (glutamine-hydrolysing)